ncbi:MAG: class I SAM-dependent methyltransferase [Bacteroidetes bacterium]|nr:class I SAM-dependent methyltransferase [Bacteroidota bacterium]MBU1678806.1 class I SAM-dependent methyltransferase [Bacteroidota bacterium]MBU2507361.1 class I SAM-dependent methyltransferase [Bacteroidota bacterium]
MKDKWDERYAQSEYVYGTEPNEFVKESLKDINTGRILFLGEGEGRNAVYAATLGWKVDAVDYSSSGKAKAESLAKQHAVEINYMLSDLADFSPEKESYDAIVLVYIHLPIELREKVHSKVIQSLKRGGVIILEAFEKEQIKNTSGGPKNIDLLYSLEDVFTDFQDLDVKVFSKEKVVLREGALHEGNADVVRYLGVKP